MKQNYLVILIIRLLWSFQAVSSHKNTSYDSKNWLLEKNKRYFYQKWKKFEQVCEKSRSCIFYLFSKMVFQFMQSTIINCSWKKKNWPGRNPTKLFFHKTKIVPTFHYKRVLFTFFHYPLWYEHSILTARDELQR